MEFFSFPISSKTNIMTSILPLPTGISKAKFHSVKIDMTPMVDLGFLLIAFFISTTSLTEPTVTKLSMPKEDKKPMLVNKDRLLTILVDKQNVFAYEGIWEEAKAAGGIRKTNYNLQTGVGNIIRQKQKKLEAVNKREELMIAIKPLHTASYQDVMNALDEMHLNDVKRYGIMQLTAEEKNFFLSKKQ
ncbi:MAG: biopolymer transporter ExbD [Chitinophagaceae bacterium]|nr:MAG: biopolymer transporter ExbD [Chitinophagaceae bacterium]